MDAGTLSLDAWLYHIGRDLLFLAARHPEQRADLEASAQEYFERSREAKLLRRRALVAGMAELEVDHVAQAWTAKNA